MEKAQYESSDDDFQYQDLESVNKGLALIGESPVVKSKLLPGAQYPKKKLEKIKSAFYESILGSKVNNDDNDESEMVKQLKIKFHETEEKSVNVKKIDSTPNEPEH